MRKKTAGTVMFASQSFDGDATPEDLDPHALYKADALLCAGILVFDVFIANCDRNKTNVNVDNPALPKMVRIFDHERALFYVYPKEGLKRLRSIEKRRRLGVTDGSESRDEWHCLVEIVASWEDMLHWIKRVESIPPWFLDSICQEVRRFRVTEKECLGLAEFLKNRQAIIGELIWENRTRFTQVKKWPLIP